jgi:protein-L-isoaspartate(D-aspartate) O-methyltransferase
VGPTGKVIGIDRIPELVNWSIENVKKDNPTFLKDGRLLLTGINALSLSVLFYLSFFSPLVY